MASLLGALATAIVAAVAGITAATIAHSAKISEFRQAWINALRDDIASYFKELDGLHVSVETTRIATKRCDDLIRRLRTGDGTAVGDAETEIEPRPEGEETEED
jgi:hypothetical protein